MGYLPFPAYQSWSTCPHFYFTTCFVKLCNLRNPIRSMPAGHCGTLICPTIYWPAFLYVLLFGASSIFICGPRARRAVIRYCCPLDSPAFPSIILPPYWLPPASGLVFLSFAPSWSYLPAFSLPCGWYPLPAVFTELLGFAIPARYFRPIRPATDLKILYIFFCCGFIIHRPRGFVNSFFEIFWKISARYYKALRTRLICRGSGQIISRRQNSAWLSGGFYVQ